MEYKKNDLLTVTIEDMGHDGEGIGKVDGYTVFVKDTVIGDKVQAKIMKAKKNYGYARLPLRYNNDKQKKPLFSRGLSVCRLLFNSFSKLKIDENYKEKRRLFY